MTCDLPDLLDLIDSATATATRQALPQTDSRYLDRQSPSNTPSAHWFWLDTWMDLYAVEPFADWQPSPTEAALVLGGEACMWSEQVDASSFTSRVWPRACAVAERLWSPPSRTDLADASARLMVHRCRMTAKGTPTGPIWADSCEINR